MSGFREKVINFSQHKNFYTKQIERATNTMLSYSYGPDSTGLRLRGLTKMHMILNSWRLSQRTWKESILSGNTNKSFGVKGSVVRTSKTTYPKFYNSKESIFIKPPIKFLISMILTSQKKTNKSPSSNFTTEECILKKLMRKVFSKRERIG